MIKEFDIRVKQKIDTTENWNKSTLILLDGEIAYEKTANGKLLKKIGNGKDLWSNLPYESQGSAIKIIQWEEND